MSEQVQRKSWFGRNWIWVLPLGGCLTVILLFIFGIGAAIFGISSLLTGSTPYEYALEQAKKNPVVVEILGDPIDTAGIMKGSISLNNDDGEADFIIPIKGSKGKGSVVVKAHKNDGEWFYEELYVLIKETNEKINLLDKSLEGI